MVLVKFAETESAVENVSYRFVNILHSYKTLFKRVSSGCGYHVGNVGHTVRTVFETDRHCLGMGLYALVGKHVLGEIAAVGYNEIKSPLVFKKLLKIGVHDRGHSRKFVVRRHDRTRSALGYRRLEGAVVVFVQSSHINVCGASVPVLFVVVGAEML